MQMQIAALLQFLVNLVYYFFLIVCLLIFICIVYILVGGPVEYPMKIVSDYFLIDSKKSLLSLLIPILIFQSSYTYLTYIIKGLVEDMAAGNLFNRYQVAGFKHAGQILIFLTIAESIFDYIFKLIFKSVIQIKFDTTSGSWTSVLLGLFFIFLSQIFKKAKDLKEENELTV